MINRLRRRTRIERSLRQALLWSFAVPLCLVSALVVLVLFQINHLLSLSRAVDTSTLVISQAYRAQGLFSEMESGIRGYLLTGKIEFLDPYIQGSDKVEKNFTALNALLLPDVGENLRLERIKSSFEAWWRYVATLKNHTTGENKELTEEAHKEGNVLMNALRKEISDFITLEEIVRQNRSQDVQTAVSQTFFISGVLTLLIAGSIIIFTRNQLLRISLNYEFLLTEKNQAVQMLNSLFESSPIGLTFLDLDLNSTRTNNAFLEIIAPSAKPGGQMVADDAKWLNFLSPNLKDVLQSQKPLLNYEFALPRAGVNKSAVVAMVTIFPIRGNQKKCIGLGVALIDISALKLAQRQSSEAQQNFRTLVETIPQLVWTTRPDGYHEYFNHRWYEYTGLAEDESIENGWTLPLHPDDKAMANEDWQHSLNTGARYEIEYRFKRGKDSQFRWFLGRAMPIRDEAGVIVRWFGTCTDIDDQKQARQRLEEEVESRTHDLSASNLALQAANSELEAFCYSVSHDLRAPLRGIDGFSQALLEDYGDSIQDEGKEYLRFVREGTQRMGHLIDDLLNLSRYTRTELTKTIFDLKPVADTIISNLRLLEPARKVHYSCANGLIMEADLGLITAALENLLANAWKFTSKNTAASIEIGTISGDERLVYYVKDNGAGFNMAYASKLFGAFQRLHAADDFKGTGIGLATVRRIIHRHGGNIWAEAEVDKGATFFFTL